MREDDVPTNPLGDPDALLGTYGERVYRFCLRLCGGRAAEAEDLTQDTLVLAWRHRDRFAGRAAPTT
jgi:RNA polymerase sigma-70 factor (ECF subfamily)